jgi:hypothetical protein
MGAWFRAGSGSVDDDAGMTKTRMTKTRMTRTGTRTAQGLIAATLGLLVVGPAVAPAGASETAVPAASSFTHRVDNGFLPFLPGMRWVYRTSDGDEHGREVVRVTDRKKWIAGVRVAVVRDRAYVAGDLVEDTFDFYAQDSRGNVWYFGEDTKTIEHGKVVSTEGSWLAGVHGAKPGIVMKAHPRVGDRYKQEDAPGVAEDRAKVLSRNATAVTPLGTLRHLLETKDFSPLEPSVVEHKFFRRGVGSVREQEVRGGHEVLVLVRFSWG